MRQSCHWWPDFVVRMITAMTILIVALVLVVVVDLIALGRELRSGATREPPPSTWDWGTATLPSRPYAGR